MAGFDNEVLNAANVDFRGVKPVVGQMTTNGDLLIGSTATPHIKKGVLTSPDSSITIGYSDPNITVQTGNGVVTTYNAIGYEGTVAVTPSGKVLNFSGANNNITDTVTGLPTINPLGVDAANFIRIDMTNTANVFATVNAGTTTTSQILTAFPGNIGGFSLYGHVVVNEASTPASGTFDFLLHGHYNGAIFTFGPPIINGSFDAALAGISISFSTITNQILINLVGSPTLQTKWNGLGQHIFHAD